jgi:hypothetical protein
VTEWGGPSDEIGKTKVPCNSRCDTIKIPPCSKALSFEQRPKFTARPSPVMVRSPYKWNNLEWDIKQQTTNNQSILWHQDCDRVTLILNFDLLLKYFHLDYIFWTKRVRAWYFRYRCITRPFFWHRRIPQ